MLLLGHIYGRKWDEEVGRLFKLGAESKDSMPDAMLALHQGGFGRLALSSAQWAEATIYTTTHNHRSCVGFEELVRLEGGFGGVDMKLLGWILRWSVETPCIGLLQSMMLSGMDVETRGDDKGMPALARGR